MQLINLIWGSRTVVASLGHHTFWNPEADPAAGPTADELDLIQRLLEQASLLKLAQEEAVWFLGRDDPAVIATGLRQQPNVVVTDGAKSDRGLSNKEARSLTGFSPSQAIETKGAGNALTAGQLHCWDVQAVKRLRIKSACGALVCSGAGDIDPQPQEQDKAALLKDCK